MTPADFRAARASLGLSQAELARVLHVHPHHVSNIETGFRVPSETLCELLRMKVQAKMVMLDKNIRYLDASGNPIVGGTLYFGEAGADPKLNPIPIFSDQERTTPLVNSQILNRDGCVGANIWILGKHSFRLSNSSDMQIYQDLDH